MFLLFLVGIILSSFAYSASNSLGADTQVPPKGAAINERVGERIPLQLSLRNEEGKTIQLAQLFRKKNGKRIPILLIPSYFSCQHLCSYTFQGIRKAADAATRNGFIPGRNYRIVSVSIKPTEKTKTALETGKKIRDGFQQAKIPKEGWVFLTGEEQEIQKLTQAVGFLYKPDGKEFSHLAASVLLSPDGKITRYLYGISFTERALRLSLVEATNGTIGGISEKILLYCFRYDSVKGKYTVFAWSFVRIGAILTMAFLLGTWLILSKKKPSKKA